MSANESGSRYVSVLLSCSAVAAAEPCPATITPKLVFWLAVPEVPGPVPPRIQGQ